MPLSKSVSKIHKNIRTKQNATKKKVMIHPNGRKFKQLNRATLREAKIEQKKREFNERRSNELARVKFLQDVINSDSFKAQPFFSNLEMITFIQSFVDRDDEEIEQLKAKRKSNRPTSNRQMLLENKKALEMEEFRKGFQTPDLTIGDNVTFLRNWNGSFGSMSTLKLIRMDINGNIVH